MTDEERKRICEDLRNPGYDNFPAGMRKDIREVAADEIERLMGEVKKGHAVTQLTADVRALRQQIEHYHGKWGKR
jgi:polyhydroxyalkanoate synthesis regulator phasin